MEYFGRKRYPGKTNAGEKPFVFQDATAQSILWSKIPYFFRAIVVLGSVSLPRLNTPRKLSVKQQTILGLLCSTYLHSRIEHNRAKPMSESASALFSIADAGEFRFARFYDVYA